MPLVGIGTLPTPPPRNRGEVAHYPAGWGLGGSTNSDEGHTLWYSLYVRTLCYKDTKTKCRLYWGFNESIVESPHQGPPSSQHAVYEPTYTKGRVCWPSIQLTVHVPPLYIVLVWNKLQSVHCSVPDYISLFRSFHIGDPSERHAAQPTNNPAATSINLIAASTTNNPAATSNNLVAASTTNSCKSAAP